MLMTKNRTRSTKLTAERVGPQTLDLSSSNVNLKNEKYIYDTCVPRKNLSNKSLNEMSWVLLTLSPIRLHFQK